MLKLNVKPDIWSALLALVPIARAWQLGVITTKSGKYYVGGADKISPEVIVELQNHAIVLLIVDGKPTKSSLTDSERDYWSRMVRESNAWLN